MMIRSRYSARTAAHDRQGFVIGELLMALLLLVVAVSSLAALMYSVSHRTSDSESAAVCSSNAEAKQSCVPQGPVSGSSKLLRSASSGICAGKIGAAARECVDSAIAKGSGETILVPRTDSAYLAMVARKEKAKAIRTDRGFIR
jgi:hypothetical protein